eukprot:CAMPEP_0184383126 /NCGR_PEP_ID=MMETSP0007-20130409/6887_1 /TAXON_ID=97485 /ORGANISM="Prymnesium parvum, Strain Texoma1" /LENGTH=96 /DNA_ID=CAMNT_0026729467 /DNA_START=306 /DNA_END=596 /DNA_ORIENTATION=-
MLRSIEEGESDADVCHSEPIATKIIPPAFQVCAQEAQPRKVPLGVVLRRGIRAAGLIEAVPHRDALREGERRVCVEEPVEEGAALGLARVDEEGRA